MGKTPKLLKTLKNEDRDHFKFSVSFQLELLRYLVQSKESILLIGKIKASYFTILEHALVCESLLRCFKLYKKIPGEPILLENTREMLNTKDYVSLATKEDLVNINTIIKELYSSTLKDEDIIKKYIKQFIAFIEMKSLNETTDFSDYNAYPIYQQKVAKIIRESSDSIHYDSPTLYMVDGISNRQLQRRIDPEVNPCPIKQLNDLTNAGGFTSGAVIVLLDKAKAKKTFNLINIARGYLAMKKNVLYIDTENGGNEIMTRMIQSTLQKTKEELYSGDYDKAEQKHMRKYRRIGSEFIVKRIPAMVADMNTVRGIIREVEAEKGIKIHVLVVDYAGKMASIARDKDDFERISNVYIDLQNLASEEKIDSVWTAHHITRDGYKHKETRYEENDISGSIAIIRNAVCIIGLNSTDEEEANNIQRMEIVVQRDGKPRGRALLNLDIPRQRMKEFSKEARKAYDETLGQSVDDLIDNQPGQGKKNRKQVGPLADAAKASRKSGEI